MNQTLVTYVWYDRSSTEQAQHRGIFPFFISRFSPLFKFFFFWFNPNLQCSFSGCLHCTKKSSHTVQYNNSLSLNIILGLTENIRRKFIKITTNISAVMSLVKFPRIEKKTPKNTVILSAWTPKHCKNLVENQKNIWSGWNGYSVRILVPFSDAGRWVKTTHPSSPRGCGLSTSSLYERFLCAAWRKSCFGVGLAHFLAPQNSTPRPREAWLPSRVIIKNKSHVSVPYRVQ